MLNMHCYCHNCTLFTYHVTFNCFSSFLQVIDGSGHLSIKLIKYDNESGTLKNGKCCDPHNSRKCSKRPCDHYFVLCLDKLTGNPSDIDNCPYGKEQTGIVIDKNIITFQNDIGGTPNPIQIPFDIWPVSIVYFFFKLVLMNTIQQSRL